MRLSDAIEMGRTLIELEPALYLDPECNRGCAIGMGLAAVDGKYSGRNMERMFELWPWLRFPVRERLKESESHAIENWSMEEEIGQLAWLVASYKKITLDQLIDWVRSVEPGEPEQLSVEPAETVNAK